MNPEDFVDDLTDEYRLLYDIVHVPFQSRDNPSPKSFTGLPSTDVMILEQLSDEDLLSTCMVNHYVNDLCRNEYFWMRRTVDKYGKVLGDATTIAEKYKPASVTWKDYYIWITDILKRASDIYLDVLMSEREDVLALTRKMYVPPVEYEIIDYPDDLMKPRVLYLPVRKFINRIASQAKMKRFNVTFSKLLSFRYNGVISKYGLGVLLNKYCSSCELRLPEYVKKFLGYHHDTMPMEDFYNIMVTQGKAFKTDDDLTGHQKRLLNDPEIASRIAQEDSIMYGKRSKEEEDKLQDDLRSALDDLRRVMGQ